MVLDYFDSPVAYNPDSDELVTGATFQVFAVDDSSYATPLALTDPASGANISVLASSNIGVLPAFRVAGDPAQVVLKSGAFTTLLTSRYGIFLDVVPDPAALAAIAAAATEIDDTIAVVASGRLSEENVAGAIAATGASLFAGTVEVVNPSALNSVKASLGESAVAPVTVNVVGDSISHGIGSDGLASQVYPYESAQQASYRDCSYVSQFAAAAAATFGGRRTSGWLGPAYTGGSGGGGWQAATASSSPTVTQSTSTGPYGSHTDAQRGGAAIPHTGWNEYVGVIGTIVEVEWWGSDSGVTLPAEPEISVDGVVLHAATTTALTGYRRRTIIRGLSAAAHTIRVTCNSSGRTVYFAGISAHDETGVVVNRIGSPGATSVDAAATSLGSTQKARVIAATVKPGTSNLLIIALGTNDFGGQIALADYKANLLALAQPVTDAGGAVLLFGGPTPRNAPTGTITEADYDQAARELAEANAGIAFVSIRRFLLTRAFAVAQGMFAASSTVHPSRRGHALYARVLAWALAQPIVYSTTASIPAPAAPDSLTLTSIAGTTVRVDWAPVVGATRYILEYRIGAGSWTAVETDALTTTLTGLTASTAYELRLSAKNHVGTSAVSPSITATTTGASTAWSDTFDVDGAFASPWTVENTTGTSTITKSGGEAYASALSGFTAARRGGQGASYDAAATIGAIGSFHASGLMLAGTDMNNGVFLVGYTTTTDFHYRLVIRTAGVQSNLATSATILSADGDVVTWSKRATGGLTVHVNGVLAFDIVESSITASSVLGLYWPSATNGLPVRYQSLSATPA